MKLASTLVTIMYNSIKSGRPWQTFHLKVKKSDRRSFILILDWVLVNATLIMSINLSPDMTAMADMIPVLEVTTMVSRFSQKL